MFLGVQLNVIVHVIVHVWSKCNKKHYKKCCLKWFVLSFSNVMSLVDNVYLEIRLLTTITCLYICICSKRFFSKQKTACFLFKVHVLKYSELFMCTLGTDKDLLVSLNQINKENGLTWFNICGIGKDIVQTDMDEMLFFHLQNNTWKKKDMYVYI